MTLAERVRAAMAAKGCTLTELAAAVGIKPPSVSGWMTGETRSLKADSALKAAKFLGVEVAWLTAGILPMRAAARDIIDGSDNQIDAGVAADDPQDEEITIPPAPEPEDEPAGLRVIEQRTVARPPLTRDEQAVLDGYRVAGEQDKKRVKEICVTALFDHGHREGEAQKKA